MAIVRVEIARREQAVRDAIIADITEVMVKHGARREGTQVLLYEVDMDTWGQGGLTYTRRKQNVDAGLNPDGSAP
ncbi:tautomerase family protein [Phytoactinopolyspora limicola]|uniref:tautomerase family protein n=1 Tax=Phytoactinopolyspora limicola TaxID=2715536 RepID=UPI00140E7508|nr:tautomerase family protein [Phytoactinopolyspora limicola]